MKESSLRAALRDDGVAIGAGVHLSDPAIVELIALAGFDWVTFSLENSTLSAGDLVHMQRAADLHRLTALLHVGTLDDPRILALLHEDIGGVVLQQAETREQAERLVEMCLFAPEGKRGAHSGVRTDVYGTVDYDQAMSDSNANIVTGLAIEGIEGVENAEEMLSVPGITIAFVGMYDLSHSLGVPNDVRNPRVIEAVGRVIEVGRRHGVPIGLPGYGHSPAELRDLGARLIMSPGNDYMFIRRALTEHVESAREALAG